MRISVRKLAESDRILTDDSPRLPYRRRNMEGKSALHWGQRKLLISEIEFLTRFGEDGCCVVYAGACRVSSTHLIL